MKSFRKLYLFLAVILVILSSVSVKKVYAIKENAHTTTDTKHKNAALNSDTYTPRTKDPAKNDKHFISKAGGGYNECITISGYSCLPNCVGYVWGRAYEILGKHPGLPKTNASTFWTTRMKYQKGQTPRLGSIAVWGHSADGGNMGHVAMVEGYDDQGVWLSESGYGGPYFRYSYYTTKELKERFFKSFLGYIYLGNFEEAGAMTTPEISLPQQEYNVGDTVTMDWTPTEAGTDFRYYSVIITHKESRTRIYHGTADSRGKVNHHKYSFKAEKEGIYELKVSAIPVYNRRKRLKTCIKSIAVRKELVRSPTITLDKETYTAGDKAHITWASSSKYSDFKNYWINVIKLSTTTSVYQGTNHSEGDVTRNDRYVSLPAAGEYLIIVKTESQSGEQDKTQMMRIDVKE